MLDTAEEKERAQRRRWERMQPPEPEEPEPPRKLDIRPLTLADLDQRDRRMARRRTRAAARTPGPIVGRNADGRARGTRPARFSADRENLAA